MQPLPSSFLLSPKWLALTLAASAFQLSAGQNPKEKSNILWIVSEDNSACYTHCYGNSYATNSHIDQLARTGFMYIHAYANSPVSAPARNAIITGMYAASNGNEQMRSN